MAVPPRLTVRVLGDRVDAGTVDVLARLRLVTRRCGYELELNGASSELLQLVAFMGLSDVLSESRLRLEPGGEAE